MELSFDAERHIYTLNGKRVPSVTEILRPLVSFDGVPAEVLARKRDLGTQVHAAIKSDLGADEEFEIDEAIGPYFDAWRRFRSEKRFAPRYTEVPFASEKYGYACTPDFIGLVEDTPAVIEWKTSFALHPATAIQTAAQAQAFSESDDASPDIKRRFSLQLRADGTYRLEQYKDKQDFTVLLSLLNVYKFKEKHGL